MRKNVQLLAADVLLAHVDDRLHPEEAATVAVATPCWPAPVSAMSRRLPMARASSPGRRQLLILWRAGVVEVLALEVERQPTTFAQPVGA